MSLYLSAARLVWGELPAVIRERDSAAVRAAADALLHVVDDAVAAFAQGHAEAGREMVRREEELRRQFIEDLLRGDSHLGDLVQRAEPFGLDLTRSHQVALAGRCQISNPRRPRWSGPSSRASETATCWWRQSRATWWF